MLKPRVGATCVLPFNREHATLIPAFAQSIQNTLVDDNNKMCVLTIIICLFGQRRNNIDHLLAKTAKFIDLDRNIAGFRLKVSVFVNLAFQKR